MQRVILVVLTVALAGGCGREAGRAAPGPFTIVQELRLPDGFSCRQTLEVDGLRMRAESCRTDPTTVMVIDPGFGVVQLRLAERTFRRVPARGERADDVVVDAGTGGGEKFAAPKAQLFRKIVDEMARPPKLEATEETRWIAGFPCRVHRQVRDGRAVGELCIARWRDLPIRAADLRGFDAMAGAGWIESVPGLPLSSVMLAPDGGEHERTEIVELRLGPIAAERFEIPAGFVEDSTPR